MGRPTFVRIAMIGPYPRDVRRIAGGVEASVFGLTHALAAKSRVDGIAVVAVPLKGDLRLLPSRRPEDPKVRVRFLRSPQRLQSSLVLAAPAALRAIAHEGSDVAHVHGTGLLQAVLLTALRIRTVPVVWTLHGIAAKETRERFRAQRSLRAAATWLYYVILERWCRLAAQQVVVDTPYVAGELGSTSKVHTVPQGVEEDAFQAGSPAAETIVSVGVLQPRKGHDLLIRAFARVVRDIPGASLRILGGTADPTHAAELAALIMELGLESSVTIVQDAERAEVLQALRTATLFALHSREESQGIAVCEAMASGQPVVATRVGGLRDVVTPRSGFLEELGDVRAFAHRMQQVLLDPELRSRLSRGARLDAERYRWPSVADDILTVYDGVLTR
jgi:glycosyltransferase involved in cell wall biosynthesis